MPTTLAPVDIANMALARIGAQSIASLADTTNASAMACNAAFVPSYLEVSRSTRWNCLMTPAVLVQVPQTPIGSGNFAPPTFTPWTASTLYTQGVYVSYQGNYYLVLYTYTSSTSFQTDLNSGALSLYNSNGSQPTSATPWAQNTFYQANSFVTYGGYYYQILVSYTSSANFFNDLTTGFLIQTDQSTSSPYTDAQLLCGFAGLGSMYPSGWAFQYQLPGDYQLLAMVNGNSCWDWDGGGSNGDDYEIMGLMLYTNKPQAVIQYVKNQPDTTQFDALFTDALAYKLAASISTSLRQDGGRLELALLQAYEKQLSKAATKNGGEKMARRFSDVRSSKIVGSRFSSTADFW